ncbi:MAG: WecB/TagA/CpsF family glycosyltransferase [Spirochaetales bacterium]|nr:WecB/TagA/CpsF family glycosyltransferase [Spirochaetales bacterium]
MRKSEYFGDIRFDHYEKEELIDRILDRQEGDYLMVMTPNVDHVVRLSKKPELLDLYLSSDVCINDSRILSRLTKMIGVDLGPVIPGSDLTAAVMERIRGRDVPVTIIGASENTVGIVKEKYSLGNVTHYNPPMGFINNPEEVDKCVRLICNNPRSLIFLAVGSPRQEIVARKAREAGATGAALCIGASLLFLSDEEKRAPRIIQKLSLEWAFRLFQSPKRLAKRYLIDGPAIFPLILRERRKRRTEHGN